MSYGIDDWLGLLGFTRLCIACLAGAFVWGAEGRRVLGSAAVSAGWGARPSGSGWRCWRSSYCFYLFSYTSSEKKYVRKKQKIRRRKNKQNNTIWKFTTNHIGTGSSVHITTLYGLEGRGIKIPLGRDSSHASRPALGHTQPPVNGYLVLPVGWKLVGAWCWPPNPFSVEFENR
jgi:hypothetical protein